MEEFMAEERANEQASQRMKEFITKRKQDMESRKEEQEKKKARRICSIRKSERRSCSTS